MRKYLLPVVISILSVLPLRAQTARVAAGVVGKTAVSGQVERSVVARQFSSQQVQAALEQRAVRAFLDATQMYRNNAGIPVMYNSPTYAVSEMPISAQTGLYPDLPFLDTAEKTSNFFIARNNRILQREIRRLEKWNKDFQQNWPAIKKELFLNKQPPKGQEMQWVIANMPKDVTTVYVGEEHDFPAIQTQIADLLVQLRSQNPEREIFLFTEFLPSDFVWTAQSKVKKLPAFLQKEEYIAIWNQAVKQDIAVVGLETPHLFSTSVSVYQHVYEEQAAVPRAEAKDFWETLEGMRLRNTYWQTVLQRYRQEHPDALFVVYSGAGHLLYNQPYALPTLLKEKSFVMCLMGTRNWLEYSYPRMSLPQRVILWQTPRFAQLAGYDAHILVK